MYLFIYSSLFYGVDGINGNYSIVGFASSVVTEKRLFGKLSLDRWIELDDDKVDICINVSRDQLHLAHLNGSSLSCSVNFTDLNKSKLWSVT